MMKANHEQRPEPQMHVDPTLSSARGKKPRVGVPAVGTLAAGSTFGRYHIDRLIGQGGMGEVYLATERLGNRAVALKIPRFEPGDADAHKRFLRESRTAGSLRHPNICPVFDVGEAEGMPYLTMSYIDGWPLSDYCSGPKLLKVRQAAGVVRKIALALVEAHAAGIVHRDLKPDNVMVDRSGEPIVMDFGLARSFDDARQTRLTQTGTMMGSPVYMSPEQIQARPDAIGPATDVYSLGVVLYELLTGRVPFDGSIGVIMAKVLTTAVPPPRQFRPEIDERLEGICLKMLAKRPSERIPSMQAVADVLKYYLTTDPPAASASPAAEAPPPAAAGSTLPIPPGLKPLPVKRIAMGIGAAFLLLVGLGISAALLGNRNKTDTPPGSASHTKVPGKPGSGGKGSGDAAFGDTELTGERYALLVGVRNYATTSGLSDLKYTDADVEGLADVLKSAGYRSENVTVMTQRLGAEELRLLPTRDRIRTELQALLRDRDPQDTVLVAFTGHGVQFKGEPQSYFCPADAQVADKSQVKSTLISLADVYKDLEESKAGFKLLLCDACRNDPFASASRRASVDLDSITRPQRLSPPGGVAAFFSCSEGEVAYEDESVAHGVFFHFIIEGMKGEADLDRDNSVSLDELTGFTKKRVPDFVRGHFDAARQMPHAVNNTRGDISLAKLSPNRPVTPSEPKHASAPPVDPQKQTHPQTPSPDTKPGTPPTPTTIGSGERAGEEWNANGPRMTFCWCPDGSFTMGSPAGEKDRGPDENQVQVTLTGFWMGKHEVTQSEWKSVMGTTLASQGDKVGNQPNLFGGGGVRRSDPRFYGEGPNHPMYYVMHEEAAEFCRKLTKQERAAGRLPAGWEFQLPTEAQWEYACRADTKTRFASGDDEKGLEQYGWFLANSSQTVHEVGKKKANAWGLHDMHGNVWEWCRDWYAAELPGGRDPEVTDATAFRVQRGGCWSFDGKDCRSADRFGISPVLRIYHLGFRAALVRQNQ